MRRPGEQGYALVAAVASIAVFAAMALTVLEATRMGLEDAAAEQAELQAGAAADAGIAIALSHLLADDSIERWPVDGRLRTARFADAALQIRIADERGKVPLGVLTEAQATRLFEQAGLAGDRLLIARDSLLDWTDPDATVRPFGAEAAYYRAAMIAPPDGSLASIDELGLVRGIDAATVARIRPYVTTQTVMSGFDANHADPRALAVMEAVTGVSEIERARTLAGQQTALEITDPATFRNRPISISVEASLPGEGRARRQMVVEITGSRETPYLVRAYE